MTAGKESIPPWTRLPCEDCGQEGLASRSYEATGPYICESCESYQLGRDEATSQTDLARNLKTVTIERDRLVERVKVLEAKLANVRLMVGS